MTKERIHPGEYVLRECLRPRGLNVTEAAEGLGVARNTLSRLINGRHGISADMAVRLSIAFGGSAESWMQLQMVYDLADARQRVSAESVDTFTPNPRLRREVVRKRRLGAMEASDLDETDPGRRIAIMWPLAKDAWAFKGVSDAESRLPRHIVHLQRRES